MSGQLPYPPPPEWGWYPQDRVAAGERDGGDDAVSVSVDDETMDDFADAPNTSAKASRLYDDFRDDLEDWGGTVLAPTFTRPGVSHPVYRLHNPLTGQRVSLSTATLVGRKPSAMVPAGCASVRLEDPTRTISRNHAAIGFDDAGNPWIEDYGSLNGTVIVVDGVETRVEGDAPVRLPCPCVVRIGDQLFEFDVSDDRRG
ncbi:FHA domain-containing protein [uncultured Bifidobacterium sp.]|uniref:FHA domain-containing protein n=1 Tax=uncultured Bifidobacterium sp. TaxID=165187 RepID=UPI00260BEFCF|nr:FHA domain-containing protein [uncultured Bifidobacterium sp.]